MNHGRRVSVIGLGNVGLPVVAAFARLADAETPIIGFDTNASRVTAHWAGHDETGEVENDTLRTPGLFVTDDPNDLKRADFHIVVVPTPILTSKRPDLKPLLSATRTVGRILKKGDIVVFESTVYPGATETECVPILEAESGLKLGRDFGIGYSSERINPGDREHRFETIRKVVSGSDAETLDITVLVYGSAVRAGIHRAPSIATAEAAKAVENTQRDLNIALVNELSLIFYRLGLDTHDVLEAAGTKWNFLRFTPGLVGGHCIGVDPYYLTHRAEEVGYYPEVILAGRRVNDQMGRHVAVETIRGLMRLGVGPGMRVTVLGLTFKEDIPDIRNTRAVDIVEELRAFGAEVQVHDPLADSRRCEEEYHFPLVPDAELKPADAVLLVVPHRIYRDVGWSGVVKHLKGGQGLVVDMKSVLDRATVPPTVTLWRL
jgi:UDP-N-acetyl-D-glucosamine/UDP-N-acetyl-D-galactosamine dehydrogenase